jgi:hypothetical protein
MDGWIWGLVIVGGPVILGIALFFAARRRRLTRSEKARSDQAARENWGQEDIR